MPLFDLNEISTILNRKNITTHGKQGISSVSIDSRLCTPESLFIGLPGKRVNGSNFLEQALQNGSKIAVIKEPDQAYKSIELKEIATQYNAAVFLVSDPLLSLQKLAEHHVKRFPDLIKIAVTGSSGKTTVKEMLHSIISQKASSIANINNLNGDIGLPLSCFHIKSQHQYAIMEMGMNRPGEITELVDIFPPNYSIITNIGQAHLGQFGTIEAIAREKKAIFSRFNGSQMGFIPQKDPYASLLAENVKGQIIFFSPSTLKRFENALNMGLDGWILYYHGQKIRFSLPGKHNLSNALLVIEIAYQLGIKPAMIKEGIEKIFPLAERSQVRRGQITVFNDCYNASPESMRAAIHFISSLRYARKIIFLGQMEELGKNSDQIHADLAPDIIACQCDAIFLLGICTKHLEIQLKKIHYIGQIFSFTLYENAERSLKKFIKEGDLLLIKGSRSMQLDRLAYSLVKSGLLRSFEEKVIPVA